jgi:hypothetical protein
MNNNKKKKKLNCPGTLTAWAFVRFGKIKHVRHNQDYTLFSYQIPLHDPSCIAPDYLWTFWETELRMPLLRFSGMF